MERRPGVLPDSKSIMAQAERLATNPPAAILVFDNFRGKSHDNEQLAVNTMLARCAVAAHIYNSTLYKDGSRPKILCFAGEHVPQGQAGSAQIARLLKENFAIDERDIIIAEYTNTTTLDLTALHAWTKRHFPNGPLAIATTYDHRRRTAQEWRNHFRDHETSHNMPPVYILSSQSTSLRQLVLSDSCPQSTRKMISVYLALGTTNKLKSGFAELAAGVISKLPDTARHVIQPFAEKKTHPYPPKIQRAILRSARALHASFARRKWQIREDELAYKVAYKHFPGRL